MKSYERTLVPSSGWRPLDLNELIQYRDLLKFFVLRDIKVIYKQTVLGIGWAILKPVLQMLVFSLVFGKLAGVPSDGIPYPLFAFAALVPWTYFSTGLTKASTSLVTSGNMLSKVYFPRLFVPLSSVIAKLLDFLIAFIILFLMMLGYGFSPGLEVLLIPFLVLVMITALTGAALWLSAMAVQFRDINHASPFLIQLLMYAAPVAWPASLIAEHFGQTGRMIYGFYPMAGVIEGFRACLLNTVEIPWDLIVPGTISSILLALSGALAFKRMERNFADLV